MIIDKVFTEDEIIKFQKLADRLPSYDDAVLKNLNKNISYHITISPFRALIEPKIKKIVGEGATVNTSAYKECIYPYPLHFDTQSAQDYYCRNTSHRQTFQTSTGNYNLAFMIPLVEGTYFKTAIFDIDDPLNGYSDKDSCLQTEWLYSTNSLDVNDYDHLHKEDQKNITKLPLIEEITWKLGSVIVWDRNKLHCSSNFAKHNLIKKMIVLFIQ